MKKLLVAAALLLVPGAVHAQVATPGDSAAIRQTALDYIEGWYEGTPSGWSAPFTPSSPSGSCPGA